MKREYLNKFCERKIAKKEFDGLSVFTINDEICKLFDSDSPTQFMRWFMQYLLNKYSNAYNNKLVNLWVKSGALNENKKSPSALSYEFNVNGDKKRLYPSSLRPTPTQLFDMIQKILNSMRDNAEFEKDLSKLYFEYGKSDEQNDSQLLKNDIQKKDNSKNLVEQVKKAMKNKQIIFTGAPGTGKTYSVREVVEEETDRDKTAYKFVQFHPSYDYSDFVEGLRPVVLLGQTEPTFVRMDGTFKAFCRHVVEENKANDGEDEKYYFIVDEINRGDLSKIFGELMFGLEESYRGEENAFDTQYKNLKT